MKRSKTPSFILTLPLATEPWQEHRLNKDFGVACKIYNMLVRDVSCRYNQMRKTRRYRKALNSYRTAPKGKKGQYSDLLKQIQTEYRLTQYGVEKSAVPYQHYYAENINSQIAQKIALRVYDSLSKLMFGNGNRMHTCGYYNFTTIEGKSNITGIRFLSDTVFYNGMELKPKINRSDPYIEQALSNRVKFCRLKRVMVRGKWKFYIQLVLEGCSPIKVNKYGELKNPISKGRVGLDIGPQTLAVCSENNVKLIEFADKIQSMEDKLRLVNRALDRSRRFTNPDFFDSDGTYIKCKPHEQRKWVRSKRYIKLSNERRELYRKQAAIRKLQHRELVKFILSLGNEVYIENMNFKALQKRSKETKKSKTGKNLSKKRFGKSLANKAPAMFVSLLEQKLFSTGGKLIKINTREAKASQYQHDSKTYNKSKLSQRTKEVSGYVVQRDLYSAFLIMNINPDLKTFNEQRCNELFKKFLILHNEEINRLKQNTYTPSSMGIKKF